MTPPIRILVTGTRGKSGIARGIKEVLCACGIRAWAKVTGTEPLSLTPHGNYRIIRHSGAHVEEMRWWLQTLPKDAEAVILENNAVSCDLQHLAYRWLKPTLTIWTNAYHDHEELWGIEKSEAVKALAKGIPPRGRVLCGPDVYEDHLATKTLQNKGCEVIPVVISSSAPLEINKSFIKAACHLLGVTGTELEEALEKLKPGPYDFAVHQVGASPKMLAFAFSANDLESTHNLWQSLKWESKDTTLWFNHRKDRRMRLSIMKDFIVNHSWKQVILTGPYPLGAGFGFKYLGFEPAEKVISKLGKRTFGIGNIAGLPMEIANTLLKNKKEQWQDEPLC
jgi:hypothetical protein